MNILFMVPYVPSQIYVRPFNLIRSLAKKGHHIHLLTLITNDADHQAITRLENACEVTAFKLPRWRSLLNAALTFPSKTPLQAVYCWQADAAGWLKDRLTQEIDDIIHVEHLRGVQYGLLAQQTLQRLGKSQPVVWDSVDSISHLFQQASSQAPRLTSRLITASEKGRTAYYEGKMVTNFKQVLVTSPVDRQSLLDLVPIGFEANIKVLPNGSDLNYFSPDPNTPREAATLIFSGKMSYHANVAMIFHLVNKILPLVWAQRPDVKLWIVGKDPGPEVTKLQKNPNIKVTGYVDDIRPYLRRATVSVSPIIYGAGIQNKILEAMACGTPVITTTKAIRSLSVKTGRDLYVADDPRSFSKAILDLLNDQVLRNQIGDAGYNYVKKHHNWTNIAARLESIYQDLIN